MAKSTHANDAILNLSSAIRPFRAFWFRICNFLYFSFFVASAVTMPKLSRWQANVLCDQLLYLNLSWSDLEDLFLGFREPAPRQYKSSSGLLDINRLDDEDFRRMFRFEKEHLDLLTTSLLLPEKFTSSQGVTVSGREALLMGLRRLAYPNRWCDLEPIFGRHSSSMSSIVSKLFGHIECTFGHLLDLTNHQWLTVRSLAQFSAVSVNTSQK